jgi:hypothetical protein
VTQAQAIGGILNVAWTLASGASPTAHRLDFFSGATAVATVNAGPSTSIAIPIPPGTTGAFSVRVTAFNGSTASPTSDPFGFTIGTSCATASVTSLQGAVSGGTASVSWTGSNAASFIVQAGSTLGGTNFFAPTNVGGATSASAPVGPGFTAFVRVTAVNACGQAGGSRDTFIQ